MQNYSTLQTLYIGTKEKKDIKKRKTTKGLPLKNIISQILFIQSFI